MTLICYLAIPMIWRVFAEAKSATDFYSFWLITEDYDDGMDIFNIII